MHPIARSAALLALGAATCTARQTPTQVFNDNSRMAVGPGSTPEGDVARGYGILYDGLGNYNLRTARAASINTDTQIKWNEYVFQSIQADNQRSLERRRAGYTNDRRASNEIHRKLREEPTASDLNSGDALNVVLEDLCNPKYSSSILRLTAIPLKGEAIRVVPFTYASMGGVISIRQLTARDGWPLPMRGEAFAARRAAYLKAVDNVLEQNLNRKLTPEAVRAVEAAVAQLKSQSEALVSPKEQEFYRQAHEFIKGLENSLRMIRTPLAEDVFATIETYSGTTVADLLAFMQRYNLRFGVATAPSERELYKDLFPMLIQQRNALAVNGVEAKP